MGLDERAILEFIADRVADVSMVIDGSGSIVWRRRSRSRWDEGGADEDVVGTRPVDRVHPEDVPTVLEALDRILSRSDEEVRVRVRMRDVHDPGRYHDAEARVLDATDVAGVEGAVVIAGVRETRAIDVDELSSDDFSLAEAAPVGLAVVTWDDELVRCNSMFSRLTGFEVGDALDQSRTQGLEEVMAVVKEVRAGRSGEVVAKRGSRWLRLTAEPLRKDVNDFVVVVSDVTAERHAYEQLARSQEDWRAIFGNAPTGTALVSTEGRFLEINPAWTAMTGYPPSELIGHTFAEITHPDDLAVDEEYVAELLEGDRLRYRMEKRYFHRSGHTLWVDLRVSLVRGPDGAPVHFVAQILDITDQKQTEEDLRDREAALSHQATHDHLTGLPNRALLDEHLRVATSMVSRTGGSVAVLFMDLDGFKGVNDTFGHGVGDEVLVEIAERLFAASRGSEVLARLGGDEFAAVCRLSDGVDEALRIARRLRTTVIQPLVAAPDHRAIDVSIGIALVASGEDPVDALARADRALYVAKGDDARSVVVADTEDQAAAPN